LKKVLLENNEDVNTMNMIVICFKNNGSKKNVDKLMGRNYKIVKKWVQIKNKVYLYGSSQMAFGF
jgi:hypothetical protein